MHAVIPTIEPRPVESQPLKLVSDSRRGDVCPKEALVANDATGNFKFLAIKDWDRNQGTMRNGNIIRAWVVFVLDLKTGLVTLNSVNVSCVR